MTLHTPQTTPTSMPPAAITSNKMTKCPFGPAELSAAPKGATVLSMTHQGMPCLTCAGQSRNSTTNIEAAGPAAAAAAGKAKTGPRTANTECDDVSSEDTDDSSPPLFPLWRGLFDQKRSFSQFENSNLNSELNFQIDTCF